MVIVTRIVAGWPYEIYTVTTNLSVPLLLTGVAVHSEPDDTGEILPAFRAVVSTVLLTAGRVKVIDKKDNFFEILKF